MPCCLEAVQISKKYFLIETGTLLKGEPHQTAFAIVT
jgi:hypothetical protein